MAVLGTVMDPEVPVISVVELGVVRDVDITPERVLVTMTPTYSGCPATEVIAQNVRAAIDAAGLKFGDVSTRQTSLEDIFVSLIGEAA